MNVTPEYVFTAYTHVTDDDGMHHAFTPGDTVPGWARDKVGDHVTNSVESWRELTPLDDDGGAGPVFTPQPPPGPQVPPVTGPGSGRPAWAQYAQALDEPITAQMSRQDIIDLLIRHGRLTDNP